VYISGRLRTPHGGVALRQKCTDYCRMGHSSRAVGIAALLAAGVAAGAAAGGGQPPPILFTSDRPDYDLVAVRLDGARRQLTRGFAEDVQPAWSPDGRRIAFTRDGKVAVIDVATRRVRVLASGRDPDWSPDGRRLVFAVFSKEREWLATISSDGTRERALGPGGRGVLVARPAWSPDGKLIAFEAGAGLWVTDPAGRRRRRLPTGGYADSPSWSPDGRLITFTCGGDAWCEVRRDGTRFRRHRGGGEPAWSPDGRLLAVTSLDGHALRLVRPGGGVLRTLLRFPHGPRDIGYGEEQEPDFSPDGRWLVLTRNAGRKPTLYAVGPAGGAARLSPDRNTEEAAGAWSPDGRRIAFRLRDGNRCFLAVRRPATGRTQRLTRVSGPLGCLDRPEWSRDGRRLVYSSARDLWAISSSGGSPTRLTRTPTAAEFAPRFGPDETTLGYEDSRGTWLLPAGGMPQLLLPGSRAFAWSHRDGRLAYVNAAGSLVVRSAADEETTVLTGAGSPDTGELIADLSWSPDDRSIAFTLPPDPAERYGSPAVAMVDVETGRVHLVAGSGDQWGSWSPDWRD
jgi:Tol biopolymer transport system component